MCAPCALTAGKDEQFPMNHAFVALKEYGRVVTRGSRQKFKYIYYSSKDQPLLVFVIIKHGLACYKMIDLQNFMMHANSFVSIFTLPYSIYLLIHF